MPRDPDVRVRGSDQSRCYSDLWGWPDRGNANGSGMELDIWIDWSLFNCIYMDGCIWIMGSVTR